MCIYIYTCCTFRRRAQRLCNAFGIRSRSNEKPGAHLPYTDPQLERIRAYVKLSASQKKVHERLICNFDQVWCTLFRPQKKCLQKSQTLKGLRTDPLARSMYSRKIRHNLERTLGLPLTEEDPKRTSCKELSDPVVQGMEVASAMVDAWRSPRTLTTLSFVDGHVGRGYVTFRQGGISAATRELVNQKYEKYLYIADPQATSHIWTEESLVHYLDFIASEIRVRRAQLQLTAQDRALVIMDQAGAHMSQTFLALQSKFTAQHNIESSQFIFVTFFFEYNIRIYTSICFYL